MRTELEPRPVRVVLLRPGVATILLALCALVGCGRGADPATEAGGREAATQFLDRLRAGQIEPAWEATTAEFKSLMGLESLRDFVKGRPALRSPAEHVSARDARRDGRIMAEHVFRATGTVRGKPATATVIVLVARDGDRWAVEQVRPE